MQQLELKLPPVALLILSLGASVGLSQLSLGRFNPSLISYGLGLIVAVFGIVICLAGVFAVHRAQTTMNPIQPELSRCLVESGIYAYSRNPMYLGFALLLLGFSLACASFLSLSLVIGFVLYLTRFQIIPEERALRHLFGTQFSQYQQRVRRWL
jgi:protein-S-isoprenylcysteine O-methyltransferase Ste14